IRENMLRIRTISLRMALDPDPKNIATYRGQLDVRNQDLNKKLDTLNAFVDTPEEKVLNDQFRITLGDYQKGMERSLVLAAQNDLDALNKLLLMYMKHIVDGSGYKLSDFSEFYAKHVDAEGQAALAQYSKSKPIVLFFVVIA